MARHVVKEYAGGTWSRAKFFGFLRSGLRRMSVRWPARTQCLHAARRPYCGPDKRRKWEYQCASCGEWYHGKEVEVDHVEPCGSLRDWDEFSEFARRLFCEADKLRVLCRECHKAREGE